MKCLFAFILFLSVVCTSKGQTVEIPDYYFRFYLSQQFAPQCFVNSRLDTACAATIRGDMQINSGASSLEGVQYFKSISKLDCSSNMLSSLPLLPTSLKELNISNNQFQTMPILPNGLKLLSANKNYFKSLPALPDSLRGLYCEQNLLTSLPALPPKLTSLGCYFNRLTELPVLPETMTSLSCENNQLTTLPTLPNSISTLYCGMNPLEFLPALPKNLIALYCSETKLTYWPALPEKIERITAFDSHTLRCLPYLPKTLKEFHIESRGLACLPNRLSQFASDPILGKLPLCSPTNNKMQCKNNPSISGKVFIDDNKNGKWDVSEVGKRGVKIIAQPSGYFTFSNDSGYYELVVDTITTYSVKVENVIFFSSESHTFTPTYFGEIVKKDFGLKADKVAKDLSITVLSYNLARPGFPLKLKVEVENLGTTVESVKANVQIPTFYHIDSTSNQNLNSFDFSELKPGQYKTLFLHGHVLSSASLEDTLKFSADVNIDDNLTDSVFMNNTSKLELRVRGSFDPNDKQGPIAISPQNVANGAFIDYTIRFQNTGTDTAFTIVVADTLSPMLDPRSMELTGASHTCEVLAKGNTFYFQFFNLLLPDSNANKSLSHGYVNFRVKPLKTVSTGQIILNTSSIYFDYNKPVITNTVMTQVKEPLVLSFIPSIVSETAAKLFPNPVENGIINISASQGQYYSLSTSEGQIVSQGIISENGISVPQLTSGFYMLETGQGNHKRLFKVLVDR